MTYCVNCIIIINIIIIIIIIFFLLCLTFLWTSFNGNFCQYNKIKLHEEQEVDVHYFHVVVLINECNNVVVVLINEYNNVPYFHVVVLINECNDIHYFHVVVLINEYTSILMLRPVTNY